MRPGRFQQKGPSNDYKIKCNENLPLETKTQKRILFLLKTQNEFFLPKNPKQNLFLIKTQNKIYSYSKPKAKFIHNQKPKAKLTCNRNPKQNFLLLKGKIYKILK